MRAAADADREGRAAIARDAASLAESVKIIAGGSGDPAALYREQLREGARLAASSVDFRGVLEAAAGELARSTAKAVEAVDGACLKVGSEWSRGAAQMRVAVLGRVFAAFGVVMAVCCVALTATCFLKLAPVFTGEAVVSYAPAYESDLDRTRLELELARNELDAYRHQYPYGIGETAQADLDAATRARGASRRKVPVVLPPPVSSQLN